MFHSGDWQISYQPLAMHFPFPPVMFNQNAFSLRLGSFSEIAVHPFFIRKNKCNKIWQEYKGKSGLSTERPQLIFYYYYFRKSVFLKWLEPNIYIFICACSTSKIMDEDFFVIFSKIPSLLGKMLSTSIVLVLPIYSYSLSFHHIIA